MVLKRMFFIILIVIVINAILISPIYAMSNIIDSGKDFLKKGQRVGDVIDGNALQSTSNFIFNMFFVVATVLTVGVGTVLGIKFVTSSVEGQAKIKESLVPFVVGCIVIFAAFPIWRFVVNAGQSATGTDEIDIYEQTDTTKPVEGTQSASEWECPKCKIPMVVPATVIIGGHDFSCPHCSTPLKQEGGKFVIK